MQWLDTNQIQIDPPKTFKRATGTRFASILGLNPWATPFEMWCAISRVYEKPFEPNKYTEAGKTIEPKVVEYLNKFYFGNGLQTPEDMYGENYFQKTYGNFFPDKKIFGGMWDSLYIKDGVVEAVIEIKTTKRVEDWKNKSPDYYALQASLYAYLLGVDRVVLTASFLQEGDYANPELFEPSADNTMVDFFKISERYPQFQSHIDRVEQWWNDYVVTGISPPYDEVKDAEILDELRKRTVKANKSIEELIIEGETLKQQIDSVKAMTKESEKRLKEVISLVKDHCMENFQENDDKVVIEGKDYDWILSRTISTDIDKDALEQDGLLEKYSNEKESYRFSQKRKK